MLPLALYWQYVEKKNGKCNTSYLLKKPAFFINLLFDNIFIAWKRKKVTNQEFSENLVHSYIFLPFFEREVIIVMFFLCAWKKTHLQSRSALKTNLDFFKHNFSNASSEALMG